MDADVPPNLQRTVLLVDGETDSAGLISSLLGTAGYRVAISPSVTAAVRRLAIELPDLVILDLPLPGMDGFELCKNIRGNALTRSLPIVVLTSETSVENCVDAFDLGAIDFITKPFSPRELIGRIQNLLDAERHYGKPKAERIVVGKIVIDVAQHQVKVGDTTLTLTPTEFRLLKHLAEHRDLVRRRDELLADVWKCDQNTDSRTVDTHVRRVSGRLGLTRETDPVKIEPDLMKLVPREQWTDISHLLIYHGRAICRAPKPLCEECVLSDICPSSRV